VPILRIDHASIKGKLLGVWQALYSGGVLDFKEINRRLAQASEDFSFKDIRYENKPSPKAPCTGYFLIALCEWPRKPKVRGFAVDSERRGLHPSTDDVSQKIVFVTSTSRETQGGSVSESSVRAFAGDNARLSC
jgi:hypothetical protein